MVEGPLWSYICPDTKRLETHTGVPAGDSVHGRTERYKALASDAARCGRFSRSASRRRTYTTSIISTFPMLIAQISPVRTTKRSFSDRCMSATSVNYLTNWASVRAITSRESCEEPGLKPTARNGSPHVADTSDSHLLRSEALIGDAVAYPTFLKSGKHVRKMTSGSS